MTDLPIRLDSNPTTLLDQMRWLYQHKADAEAITLIHHDGNDSISYHDLFTQSARYAHALEQAGVQSGDLVALVLQHGDSVIYGFWGAMLLGAIPSIFPFLTEKLDPDRYFDSLHKLVEHENVRVVITYDDLESKLNSVIESLDTTVINKDSLSSDGDIEHYLAVNPSTITQPEDTAFLQHSSGSTGLQKGVMLSHQAVINQIASYSDAIRLTSADKVVSWLPLYHDMGLIAGFIMPILQGIPLVLMSPFQWVRDPKILLWAIHTYRGTLCWLPNFAYNFLATRIRDKDLAGLDLSSLRAVVNCSEPVAYESHRVFAERFADYGFDEAGLTTCYAMAENTFAVTQGGIDAPLTVDTIDRDVLMNDRRAQPADSDSPSVSFVSCGKPITHCELMIVDDNRAPLPERHIGEIVLRSNSMLTGYYQRPDASESVMADGWYYTGDMGYLADDELYITGRKKDLIIVGGKNVYPQDIEHLMNDIDGVHAGRVSAFGIYNDKLGTEDIAIVVEVDKHTSIEDNKARSAILREVRARVAKSTDVTAKYVHVAPPMWLIKTSSGKIARTATREKFIQEVLNKGR